MAFWTTSVLAQTGLSGAGEFRVNTTTADGQGDPHAAPLPGDGFVTVWTGRGAGTAGTVNDVIARLFDASLSPRTPEFLVNTPNGHSVEDVTVAAAPNGNFVVAWAQLNDDGTYDTEARIYDRNGGNIRLIFPVASGTGDQRRPAIAMADDGRFVIAWDDTQEVSGRGIFARRYTPDGTSRGGVISVNTTTANDQVKPAVAFGEDREFLVTWDSTIDPSPAGKDVDIRGRLFDDDGIGQAVAGSTNEFRVAEHADIQQNSSVAFAPGAGFLVVWQDRDAASGDLSGDGIAGRRLDARGNLLGSRFLINDSTIDTQFIPTVRALSANTFGVTWSNTNFDGDGTGVVFRRFVAANGANALHPLDANDLRANTYFALDQVASNGALVPDSKGNCLIIWHSDRQEGDHSASFGRDVYADKFYLPNQGPPLREFRVNTTTAGNQTAAAVAMNAGGQAVVVWIGSAAGSFRTKVFLQRYDAIGGRAGVETVVSESVAGNAANPSVAICATGDFIVAWAADPTGTGDPDIFAQRFDSNGATQGGGPFRVNNDYTDFEQGSPSVSMASKDNFVIVWQSDGEEGSGAGHGIYGQLYLAGSPSGREFHVNTTTQFDEALPRVAMNVHGDFNVVWRGEDIDFGGGGTGVFYRRYKADGSAKGGESLVNDPTANSEEYPSVALEDDGRFIVSFDRQYSQTDPSADVDVFARIYTPNANDVLTRSSEIAINSIKAGKQVFATVAATQNGNFRVAWESYNTDVDAADLYERAFRVDGTSLEAADRPVNVFTTGVQRSYAFPQSLAIDVAGNYFVVWRSSDQDGSGYGIYATKVFVPVLPTVVATALQETTGDSAILYGVVNSGSAATTVYFEYGLTGSLGLKSLDIPIEASHLDMPVAVAISGLLGGSTYYYRTVAKNDQGPAVVGPTMSFSTAPLQQAPSAVGTTRPLKVNCLGFQWRLAGRDLWNDDGKSIPITPGEYVLEFRAVTGNVPRPDLPALPPQRILIADGVGLETRTIDPLTDSRPGNLVVIIQPDEVASSTNIREQRGQWRFAGETSEAQWRNGGLAGLSLPAGAYRIEFRQIDGRVGVAVRSVIIQPGLTTQVRVFYETPTQVSAGAAQPVAVTASDLVSPPVDAFDVPLLYSGQFITDAGSGSGTVVKERVVLTAAHVIFDDVTLTYTTGVQWLFQRLHGDLEPQALTSRGSYVFSSYASARTTARDQPGVGVGQATQSSQQRDAAAVYFARAAGRSGFTDVLATGNNASTEWLANNDPMTGSPRQKTLVSYPVDLNFLKPPTYGEQDAGRMFRTPARAVALLKKATELVPGLGSEGLPPDSRVYQTPGIAGYAGGSGGGLWVQFDDGNYYPAAIYLGGTDQSVFRAIDASIVDLITRAHSSPNRPPIKTIPTAAPSACNPSTATSAQSAGECG